MLAGLSSFPTSASAGTCALCRQALASSGNGRLIQGFYWSILLIAGVPLIIMGVIAFSVWRSAHSQRLSADRLPPETLAAVPPSPHTAS